MEQPLNCRFDAGLVAAPWPAALLIFAVVQTIAFCSRGPLVWGESLASLATRRVDRKTLADRERALRAKRIAELEAELGITDPRAVTHTRKIPGGEPGTNRLPTVSKAASTSLDGGVRRDGDQRPDRRTGHGHVGGDG